MLTDTEVRNAVAALQIQLDRDWLPQWCNTANLVFYSKTQSIPSTYWPIYIQDTSDISGALGYHTETRAARPYGRVLVNIARQHSYSWTVTLSHEILEMMADPFANLTVFYQTTYKAGRLYAFEVSDAVGADAYGYLINDILVSNFVFPSWIDHNQTSPDTRYDQTGRVTAPFQILRGGYISVFNVGGGSVWTTITYNNVEADDPKLSDRNRWLRD